MLRFTKMNGAGNDFVMIDNRAGDLRLVAEQISRICDRHRGVGADGVEWMYPHSTADLEIRLINADGSKAEISGNGTRCVAAYVCAERRIEKIRIQTGAGLKTCRLAGRSESNYDFEVEMGEAQVGAELAVKLGAKEVRGIPVSLGNPHYAVFVRDFAGDWQAEAAKIQLARRLV